ncbi:MAG: transketolase C-terminal domain-containing protein, partial [Candidatus Neomarinimicrobiota bacterium]
YDSMITVFRNVRELPYPTMVHVLTRKGRGHKEAEADSLQFYSMPGRRKGPPVSKAPDFNQVFGKVAIELAKADDQVCCITAAMEVGTGLTEYAQLFPDRYYDVGLAEEHAVTFAGGLAVQGLRPVVAIYSTFLQRAFDQIMHDIALQNLPVIFCLDRSGLVGPDGPTHHGVFDLAIMRTIPGVVVCAPKDGNELRNLMFSAKEYNRPVIIRYPKDTSLEFAPKRKAETIPLGRWERLRDGADAVILAVGSMVPVALQAASLLEAEHDLDATVVNARFVKPLDEILLRELALPGMPLVTVEEGLLAGGFGSAVRESLAAAQLPNAVISMGIGDEFTEHATRAELLEMVGLTPEQVAAQVLGVLESAGETG